MRAGEIVAERFEIEALAGQGAMGAVYRARDRATGDAVALKVLRGAEFSARFVREARVLSGIAHPAIVRYVAHGSTASQEPFLAMEWLDGEDLTPPPQCVTLTAANSVSSPSSTRRSST